MKLFASIAVLTLVAVASVQALDCYSCEGDQCDNLTDSNVVSCPAATTTTTVTSSPTASTPPTTGESTASTPSTTGESTASTPSTTGQSTASTPSTTGESTASTPSTTVESTAATTVKAKLAAADAVETLINNYRLISRNRRDADGTGYACYVTDIKKNDGSTGTQRGCIAIPQDEAACDAVVNQIQGAQKDSCWSCQTNRCNSGVALNISIVAFLAVFIAKIFV